MSSTAGDDTNEDVSSEERVVLAIADALQIEDVEATLKTVSRVAEITETTDLEELARFDSVAWLKSHQSDRLNVDLLKKTNEF